MVCSVFVVSNPVGPAGELATSGPSLDISPFFHPRGTARSASAALPVYLTVNMHCGLDLAYDVSTALGANTGLLDFAKEDSDISRCSQDPPLAAQSRIEVL